MVTAALIGCNKDEAPTESSSGGSTPTASNTDMKGQILIDGSTTVYPIVQIMAEDFGKANSGVKLTVNKSGTGSGFKNALDKSDLDIVTASRPIKDSELKDAQGKQIEYIEIPIAYDGVSIVVNPDNSALSDVTPEQLKTMFVKDSNVKMWSDVNPAWPKEAIKFYGPSDNHGTYEYFQEAVLGKGTDFRSDYQPNQEYNTIIGAVAQDKNGIAYVGFNYYASNKDKVKAVTVNGVAPSDETIKDGTYVPLSRPLFLYVKKSAMDRPEIKAFVDFALGEGASAVTDAQYVELPSDAMDKVKSRVSAGTTGSVFMNAKPGMSISQVIEQESK